MAHEDGALRRGDDGLARCFWCAGSADYAAYHDREWGRPVVDDRRLYEKLCLEGFQAGLSWLTILRKREAFRRVFAGFDPEQVARFGAADVRRLLADPAIVRHRGKIEAAIENARAVLRVQEAEGSLAALVWRFEPPESSRPARLTRAVLAARTRSPESEALSKTLRRLGFRFVGPTTAYAFMQAMGLVDDHLDGCHVRDEVERARVALVRPSGARSVEADRLAGPEATISRPRAAGARRPASPRPGPGRRGRSSRPPRRPPR